MISITNIGDKGAGQGSAHRYILRINRDEICEFEHLRHKGLAACLRAAADAIDRKMDMDTHRLLAMVQGGK